MIEIDLSYRGLSSRKDLFVTTVDNGYLWTIENGKIRFVQVLNGKKCQVDARRAVRGSGASTCEIDRRKRYSLNEFPHHRRSTCLLLPYRGRKLDSLAVA